MAKLYFYQGVMESSKTLQLLAVAHNYEVSLKKPILTFKPKIDDRNERIETRAGLFREVDVVLDVSDNNIMQYIEEELLKPECILVDECQFLTKEQVYAFSDIVDYMNIPVIMYGLKTDFQCNLFEGSQALLEIADKVEEVKTVCYYCDRKALMNMRLLHEVPIFEGEQIEIGDTTETDRTYSYRPVCRKCYKSFQNKVAEKKIRFGEDLYRASQNRRVYNW